MRVNEARQTEREGNKKKKSRITCTNNQTSTEIVYLLFLYRLIKLFQICWKFSLLFFFITILQKKHTNTHTRTYIYIFNIYSYI